MFIYRFFRREVGYMLIPKVATYYDREVSSSLYPVMLQNLA